MTTPKPPGYLRKSTRLWWVSVVQRWELDPHHEMLLTAAATAWDRMEAARQVLQREGLTSVTRDGGRKAHPCVAIERDSRLAFARLLRELDLDVSPPSSADDVRPPLLRRFPR